MWCLVITVKMFANPCNLFILKDALCWIRGMPEGIMHLSKTIWGRNYYYQCKRIKSMLNSHK